MIRLIPGSTDAKKKAATDNRKLAARKKIYEAAVAAFHPKTFEKVSDDFKAGRMKKVPKWRASDPVQSGLVVVVTSSGDISWHASYMFGDRRPYIVIGRYPEMSMSEARQMTKLIRDLAANGVDVQEGLHSRLIAELKRDGIDWRPEMSAPPRKRHK